MVITPDALVAIEAKFTEPPYEDVRSWLRSPRETNRESLLGGWVELIRSRTATKLDVERLLDLPYQLIHRTAAACNVQCASRALVYQIFGTERPDYYAKTLTAFRNLLGRTQGLMLFVVATKAEPLDAHRTLPADANVISAALCAGPCSGLVSPRFSVSTDWRIRASAIRHARCESDYHQSGEACGEI
jgi:hypothetical protein